MMQKVVFTNGCFDILHVGHIDLLERAKSFGTKLIVGINSDKSVRAIKGEPRPFVNEKDRAAVLLALSCVDEVRIFDETTPQNLIEEVKPDVLIKGGDWKINEIIGADFVIQNGGEVHSLPLKQGFSTTALVEKILDEKISDKTFENNDLIAFSLKEHQEVFQQIDAQIIRDSGEIILSAIENGKKIMLCGNGGSASDAQHIATELVCRFETERQAIAAIALTTDTSALTAISNDYGYEYVFSRQIEALASEGDVLIAISTSGNSPNVLSAVMKAREKGCKTIGLTGKQGKKLASLCDKSILVPSDRTARIQEAHITIGHIWCELVDAKYSK
jgi:D-sedoheptulose 7-phosphate isomerase